MKTPSPAFESKRLGLFENGVGSTQRSKVGVQYTPPGAANGPDHVAQFLEFLLDLPGTV
jgi:hypothetical protein